MPRMALALLLLVGCAVSPPANATCPNCGQRIHFNRWEVGGSAEMTGDRAHWQHWTRVADGWKVSGYCRGQRIGE